LFIVFEKKDSVHGIHILLIFIEKEFL
jgi:hypothetical protein